MEKENFERTNQKLTPEQQEFEANWFENAAAGMVGRLVKENALTAAQLKSRRANASTTTNTDAPAIGPE